MHPPTRWTCGAAGPPGRGARARDTSTGTRTWRRRPTAACQRSGASWPAAAEPWSRSPGASWARSVCGSRMSPRLLTRRLSTGGEISMDGQDHQRVGVGSWVLVRDGRVDEAWQIVEPAEADPAQRRISTETPVARALLGRRPGEQVRVWGPEQWLLTIQRVWTDAGCVEVVGGTGAGLVEHGPQLRWPDVLAVAESVRMIRPPDAGGAELYEVLAVSGHVSRYLVEETRDVRR